MVEVIQVTQPATVKVISENVNDVTIIVTAISNTFESTTTSGVIYDPNTRKYHQFVSVIPK